MTTPPAHAAQTVDVSRDAVEAQIRFIESVQRILLELTWTHTAVGLDQPKAQLRALLDAKEKAEQQLQEYKDAHPHYLPKGDPPLSFKTIHAKFDSSNELFDTGNDDTGEMT